jgi:hypothetical protein
LHPAKAELPRGTALEHIAQNEGAADRVIQADAGLAAFGLIARAAPIAEMVEVYSTRSQTEHLDRCRTALWREDYGPRFCNDYDPTGIPV